MGKEILRKEDNQCKGPEVVGFLPGLFQEQGAEKTEWRGRLVENEKIQKSNKRARLCKTL